MEEILPPNPEQRDLAGHAATVADRKKLVASKVSCREGMRRAKSTLGPGEGDLVLFAFPAALDRDGDCWEVRAKVTVFNEILGYLDPATGALLFSWFVPEG